jgi:hypothetical protein
VLYIGAAGRAAPGQFEILSATQWLNHIVLYNLKVRGKVWGQRGLPHSRAGMPTRPSSGAVRERCSCRRTRWVIITALLTLANGGCNLGTAYGCAFSHSCSSIPSARMVPQFAPRVERLIGLSLCAFGPVRVDC